ncbi:AAA family ATPase [Lichenibacterium minor]|uniref:AAA family ATPase n=1 Tax=Lichenibacterium minor TaxID=2316528 RepID=A0A4Q2TZ68_9HYPH|nr:AAA family ATPase [Lichenibacterium minor]RYC29409.1 AAA family ATPase [Lichenibacterium minor]
MERLHPGHLDTADALDPPPGRFPPDDPFANGWDHGGVYVKPGERRSASHQAKHFDLIPFDEIQLSTAPNYAVKGLLPKLGLAVIWGPPKCGKSFFVSDLLLHVALGWAYRGRRVRQAAVVYCCLEGAEGFNNRMLAFRQAKLGEEAAAVPFYLSPTPLDLVKDHAALITSIRSVLGDMHPGVIALDTVNRSLAGSESSDEDMSAYIRAADALRDAFKCLIVLVHHCGLDATRPRGHTSLTGALDVQIAVKKAGDLTVSAIVEFNKDGPEGAEIVSRLVPVEIGTDDDGDPISTLVVEAIEGERPLISAAIQEKGPKLTDDQKLGLEALLTVTLEIGKPLPSSFGIPGNPRAVSVTSWRGELERRGIVDPNGPNPRQIYKRIHDGLCAKAKAAERDGQIWPL